jgi:hypothetical protein
MSTGLSFLVELPLFFLKEMYHDVLSSITRDSGIMGALARVKA